MHIIILMLIVICKIIISSQVRSIFVPYLIYKFTTLVTQEALWWPVGIEEVNDSSTDIPCSFALSLSIRIHH